MKRSRVTLITLLIILFIALWTVRPLVLGGAAVVELASAPALTGQISQALASSGAISNLPIAGKDYNLNHTTYFDNGNWVVTTITGLDETTTSGMAVLKKQGNIYSVVLGPGSAFPSSYVQNLPAGVAQYLNQKGAVYEPVSE